MLKSILARNNILERYARAQSRPFRGGLAELSVSSGAEERPPLTVEESPPFQGGVLQYEGFRTRIDMASHSKQIVTFSSLGLINIEQFFSKQYDGQKNIGELMLKYWFFLFAPNALFALTTLQVTLSSDNDPGGFGDPGDLRNSLNTMNQNLNTTPDATTENLEAVTVPINSTEKLGILFKGI